MFSYRSLVLLLLTLAYTLNFIDRQILGVISPALKEDLSLSDGELGLLKGFAFALLYTTLGVPIARLADRSNRKMIVSGAIFVWSLFTLLSGLATNFVQLFFCRIGVGIGEAGGTPPSHSIISDYFDKDHRGTALSVFAFGVPVGVALAYLVGGTIATQVSWRAALLCLGGFGIVLSLLIMVFIREPRRNLEGETIDQAASAVEPRLSTFASLKGLWQDRAFRLTTIAVTLVSFATYSIGAWIVDFFVRTHPTLPLSFVLVALGLINGLSYGLGTLLGGRIVDRWSKSNRGAYGLAPGVAVLVSVPLFVGSLWIGPATLSLVLWTGVHLVLGVYIGPSFALVQNRARPDTRALAAAFFFFVINLVALGFGPTFVGFLSGLLAPAWGETLSLQAAMSALVLPLLASSFLFFRLGHALEREASNPVSQS